jgi:hypothetical protein
MNHLNPTLNKDEWTLSDDIKILTIYQEEGPRWAYMARKLKNRTEHMVKNRFNSLRKKWISKNDELEKGFRLAALMKELKQLEKKTHEKSSSKQSSEKK